MRCGGGRDDIINIMTLLAIVKSSRDHDRLSTSRHSIDMLVPRRRHSLGLGLGLRGSFEHKH